MIKLIDILKEITVNNPRIKIPEGWSDETDSYENDADDIEIFGGKIIKAYSAPMEGWDEKNQDSVKVIKREDGKFIVNQNYAFGDNTDSEPFDSSTKAILWAIDVMEEIKEDWDEEEY
jgi:hypothetical protein